MSSEEREWYKLKGICTCCRKELAMINRTMCPECLDKTKENSERTRSTESKEQRKEYVKKKRQQCIENGICRECLKRKVMAKFR